MENVRNQLGLDAERMWSRFLGIFVPRIAANAMACRQDDNNIEFISLN